MSINLLSEALVPCFVDGKAFIGSSTFTVVDPHNPQKVLHTVSSVTKEDVDKILEIAVKAIPAWKAIPVPARRAIFIKAAALLRERIPEYAVIESEETTSSMNWSGFDQTLACDSLEETAAAATVALRGEIATTEDHQQAHIVRCPYGIVFGAAPWNAPVVLGQRAVMQPIIGGNVAILKTSELSPKTQLIIAQVFAEAGLPAGVLSIIHVAAKDAPSIVEQIIAHPAVGKINFTGSTRVGSMIASTAGKHLKPIVLELGGKAPIIICADADLKHAANAILFGAWFHSGQICMASQTAIVHESISDELLTLLQAHAPNVKASGNDKDGASLRGLFTDASAERTREIVEDALGKGAKVALGEVDIKGNVVQPLMLTGVTEAMRIYREEMFSPVFSMITYKTEEEALFIANDHDFGLASAVWTKDTEAGYRIAKGINAGMVHINGSTVHDAASMPHGGWKKSGYGRFNGIEGIREFTQIKVITLNQSHGQYPI